MKSVLLGMVGAAIALAMFASGSRWQARRPPPQPIGRYQLCVQKDSIVRLDTTTGAIHVVGAANGKAVVGDLPEKMPAR